jgi:aminopeptidase N
MFVQKLFGTVLFDELTLDGAANENDDRRALRAIVIDALSAAGNDLNLSATAQARLERAMQGGTPLDSTAGDAIVRAAARTGDAGWWDRLRQASADATSPAEQYRYLYALGWFQNPALIDRGLNLSLTNDVRSQDTAQFLNRFLRNSAARPRAWSFIKQHWAELAPKVTIALGDVRLVEALGSFCDAGARDDIRRFFTTNTLPAASRTLDQTLERINNCISLKDRQSAALTAWLAR